MRPRFLRFCLMVVDVFCTNVCKRGQHLSGLFVPSDRVKCVNPHRQNASLQTLHLYWNKFGDVGVAAICEGMRCVKYYPGLHSFLGCVLCVVFHCFEFPNIVVVDGLNFALLLWD